MMKTDEKKGFLTAAALLALFILWTVLIQTVDVRPAGQNGTDIGFACVNLWFHRLTGVHLGLYTVTDWLGLVPVGVGMGFALLGLVQWFKRRRLGRVDYSLDRKSVV